METHYWLEILYVEEDFFWKLGLIHLQSFLWFQILKQVSFSIWVLVCLVTDLPFTSNTALLSLVPSLVTALHVYSPWSPTATRSVTMKRAATVFPCWNTWVEPIANPCGGIRVIDTSAALTSLTEHWSLVTWPTLTTLFSKFDMTGGWPVKK